MSVKTRIQELNTRLAEKLTNKGVEADGAETTTALIDKVDDIASGGKEEQEKSLTITENGSYQVLPDENKVLSSVSVDVEIKDNEYEWQEDASEIIFEKTCYQNAEISCLITENGTLTYKRNDFDYKNQTPKWAFDNTNQIGSMLGVDNVSMWLKVEQAEVINAPEATGEYLITALGQSCFCSLYSLKRVRLPDTITKIGNKAFSYCISLKEVNLPDTIDSFESECFSFCYSLEEFDIPTLVTSLPSHMFRDNLKLTKINGTERLTSINSYCFSGCSMLEEITFGENLSTVGEFAFNYCITLKKVQFKSNSITFGKNVFVHCNGLEDVSFISGSIQNGVSFAQSTLLSAESIQSIIDGLAPVETAQKLTLHSLVSAKLTDEQMTQIWLKNWDIG